MSGLVVTLVTPRYPPTHAGGGETSARLLAEQLATRAWVDEVVVLSFDGDTTETVGGVPVHRLGTIPKYPYTLPNEMAYRRLRAFEVDCDILHAYNMYLHPTVGRLAAERSIPAVATLNAYPFVNWAEVGIDPSFQRQIYERTLLRIERPRLLRQMREIDLFLPLSRAVERVYRANGLPDADYETVPNMIDRSFTVPDRSTDSDPNVIRLLYVGYLRDTKGVRDLVDATTHLSENYVLRIVGDGPERDALEARAVKRGIADNVTFVGKVPYEKVEREYADADVFVHPGVWPEPFGRTILEAMQAGLPVVATNVGGPAETIPQSELLCEPGDPVALADCIERAAADRTTFAATNAQVVQERYNPDAVVAQIREAYQRVYENGDTP